MTYLSLAPGLEGEEFEQYSHLLRASYPAYRIRTTAGNDCGTIFFRHFSIGGGWFVDQRSIGDSFINPRHFPTPREAAMAAVGQALRLLERKGQP